MNPAAVRRIVTHYSAFTAWDRFHLMQRLRRSCYEELLPHLPESGNLLDIGCGFGQLRWFLQESKPKLEYYGSDIDARKINLGKPGFGNKADRLFNGDFRKWKWLPSFSVITVLDVLYLLPIPMQKELLVNALGRLEPRPESVLILKILPPLRGFIRWRTWIQERMMVGFGKTKGSGALFASQNPEQYLGWGRELGFEVKSIALPVAPPSQLLVFRPR